MTDLMTVDLPDNLTIANAEALHEQLESVSHSGRDVQLNGAAVGRIDTAALQMLYAFVAALRDKGVGFSWMSPSGELIAAAEGLGMKSLMGLAAIDGGGDI